MKIIPLVTWMNHIDSFIIKDVPVTSTIVVMDDALIMVDTGMVGNQWLEEDLISVGYFPSDFDLVINTHLHPDHIGGNRLFTNARIIISQKEWNYQLLLEGALQDTDDPARLMLSIGRKTDENNEIVAKDLKNLANKYPLKEIIGNIKQIEFIENKPSLPDGLSLLTVPGHSIDSQAVILKGQYNQAMIAGDALYHRSMWKQDYLPNLHYDADMFNDNARKLSLFKGIIIPGHDHAYDTLSDRYIATDVIEI
jgi:glyoxylase-like metal-dependent hydrolase (beta-lactamase superfamily II)